jgi:solute carrier family 25 carnitine/acylcarnitine transporter 20/29
VGYGFYFWGYELCSRWMSAWAPPSSSADGDGGGGVMSSEAARVLLCGGLAGIITWASIFPLDVIKTRMQAQPDVFSSHHHPRSGSSLSGETTPLLSSSQHRYPQAQQQHPQQQQPHPQSANTNPTRHTAWAVAKDTYRAEGWRAFFRGLGVCSARAFVVNAVQWAVYEWIMAELGQGRRPQQQHQQQNNEEMRAFSG